MMNRKINRKETNRYDTLSTSDLPGHAVPDFFALVIIHQYQARSLLLSSVAVSCLWKRKG